MNNIIFWSGFGVHEELVKNKVIKDCTAVLFCQRLQKKKQTIYGRETDGSTLRRKI